MICPNCKHNNPESSKFCNQCGTKLPQPLVCPKCGCDDMPEDSKFCPDCGAKLVIEPTSNIMVINVNGVEFKMIKVEGGTFEMKETVNCGKTEIIQKTKLSDYWIGEALVTQRLWYAIMGSNPSFFKGSSLPVEKVTWNDCQDFIKRINTLTGKLFRLPTEAEWEYAARGGNKSKGYTYSGSNTIEDVAWYHGNSGDKTHPVKTKSSNELGIYDMSGNVREWCQDRFGNYKSSYQTNPTGPSCGTNRVYRGGSWGATPWFCRSSNRNHCNPNSRNYWLGFRLVFSD